MTWLDRWREALRQTLCGLRGHDELLHFEEQRMALRCVSCGHETPGWELNETPPIATRRSCAPFADWPESAKRDRALDRWRVA